MPSAAVVADLRHDFVNTLNRPLDAVDEKELHRVFADQIAEGERLLSKESVEITEIRHIHSVDMQFVGQSHLLRVPLETPTPDRATLRRLFEDVYFRRFRVELAEIRANLVNVNTSVIGVRPALDLSTLIDPAGHKGTVGDARTSTRPIHFAGEWHDTPIYWRDHLPAEFRIEGPAVIEQMDTTVLIEPGDEAQGGWCRQYPCQRGRSGMSLDPITLSVIQAGLQQVCDEMDLSFFPRGLFAGDRRGERPIGRHLLGR